MNEGSSRQSPLLAGALRTLESELVAEFERDPRGKSVATILSAYAAERDDWRKFALCDAHTYSRNLVTRNDWFELLILCWQPNQKSPIHNHAGQNCWMAVLEGKIEEQQFELPAQGRGGALVPGNVRTFAPGKVAFINDDIALHLVRPESGRAGTSLHLYSRPIETCNVYEEATGNVVRKRLSYHSIRGELCR